MNLSLIPPVTTPSLAGTNTAKPSKLHAAAQQFEALVIGEMLRTQRENGSEGWLGSGGDDSGSDSAMDLAEGQLSNALAAAAASDSQR